MIQELWQSLPQWLPQCLQGLGLSLELTLAALALGLPLGLLLSLGISSHNWALKALCFVAIELGRGAPALVVLQFVYFGLPSAGLPIGAFAAGTVALGWNTGAYTSEVMGASLNSIQRGQREAAHAIGLGAWDSFFHVLLPQAAKVAIPPLLGISIILFQLTSLCFTISLPELLSRAYNIGSDTFLYLPALVLAGLIYAAVAIPASLVTHFMEARLHR